MHWSGFVLPHLCLFPLGGQWTSGTSPHWWWPAGQGFCALRAGLSMAESGEFMDCLLGLFEKPTWRSKEIGLHKTQTPWPLWALGCWATSPLPSSFLHSHPALQSDCMGHSFSGSLFLYSSLAHAVLSAWDTHPCPHHFVFQLTSILLCHFLQGVLLEPLGLGQCLKM